MSEILKKVARMLDKHSDVAVVPGGGEEGKIHFGVRTGGMDFISAIAVCEPPVFQIRTTMLAMAPDPKYRPLLMKAILDLNNRLKFAKFAFDAKDGEIVVYCDLLIGKDGPTEKQINRCVQLIKRSVNGGKTRLEKIANTGTDSGMEEVRAAQGMRPEDLLGFVERLRKAAGAGGPSGAEVPKKGTNGAGDKKPGGFGGLVAGISDDEIFDKNS